MGAPAFKSSPGLDVMRVREDFPILQQPVYGRPLVFLDSAASAQKPRAVIEAMNDLMTQDYANINRGVYHLSQRATTLFEEARAKVARFINATEQEVIFTRSTTEAINLVAATWGKRLEAGDEVLITELEHHANIVPWHLLQADRKFTLKAAPIEDDGTIDLDKFAALITPKTRLVSVTHMSNALGSILPVRDIIALAHARGIPVLLDGSQSVVHMPIDVRALDCDFFVFTGHKLYGPTGIGVLYGKNALLNSMPPYQGGGDMIETVSISASTYRQAPNRFEAGTPAITEAVGLGAAIDYLESFDRAELMAHEERLFAYMNERLSQIDGLRIYGSGANRGALVSFTMEGVHPHDIGTIIDHAHSVAIRVGHHCAQPLMARLGLAATARASLGIYNTRQDIDVLADALEEVREMFAR
jgi:cysteine desulfurase/selenocysteine lyase